MGFEPMRAEPNGLAVHRLNLSANLSPDITLIWLLRNLKYPFQPIMKINKLTCIHYFD